jgi:hypothetical protein
MFTIEVLINEIITSSNIIDRTKNIRPIHANIFAIFLINTKIYLVYKNI